MKKNLVILFASLMLMIVCTIALLHPKTQVLADGGGGGPVPPCPTKICPLP